MDTDPSVLLRELGRPLSTATLAAGSAADGLVPLSSGIGLLNGGFFDFQNPENLGVFTIEDIAHVASHICRFAGHVPHFYPLAQHLVNTSLIVAPCFAKAALLHDTSEVFTNDIVTPLKILVPAFKRIEERIEAEMARRFEYQYPYADEVKTADLQMLAIEKHILRPMDPQWAMLDGVKFRHLLDKVNMEPMTPAEAKAAFLKRYEEVRFL